MKKVVLCIATVMCVSCTVVNVNIVTTDASVLEIGDARFAVQENSVPESTLIILEKKSVKQRSFQCGFELMGTSYTVRPDTLCFDKPILFSLPAETKNAVLAVRIGNGFVPIAGSGVEGETLHAKIWHGGEYYVVRKPEQYGIMDHSETKEALLVVSDIYVGNYVNNLRSALHALDYSLPIWTFVYPGDKSIEDNAQLLAKELEKLHNDYGEFRLDIVSFGVGGLITHRYVADKEMYQRDISPVIIAIGTPFFGCNFANIDNAKNGKSPFRFFFIDGMGEHAKDLQPDANFIEWVKDHKHLRGGWYKDAKEDKNPASIRGKMTFPGELPEEQDGDGLISLSSTMLTAIEPEPFAFNHFDLFENPDVLEVVGGFVQLYRTFAWMDFFLKVWDDKEPFARISEIWEQEVKLHFRNMIDFEVLIEWNENMLKSAPQDAILITNGDNDTYPAWFLQERGIRNDVIVLNRNLFNLKEYIRFLQKNGLPLEITEQELDKLKHYYKKDPHEVVTISDQLIKLLLKQNKRPVVFATTVYKPDRYDYPLRLSGLVCEIDGEGVAIEQTKELLHKTFSFTKIFSTPIDSLSIHIKNLARNYAASAFQLAMELRNKERFKEALEELRFAKRFSDEPMFYYEEAITYLKMEEFTNADSTFNILLGKPGVDMAIKKNIAGEYYKVGEYETAIEILAECLKENPGDTLIPGLIKKYQEEL